ncbi:hypothetical protein E1301_Tti016873 [Triplophysa tibetana]|uniref:Uncharacterized protein n=1 Tax=Triplophysa tibetana TaxID=1572043 RepID=A0A5A9N9R8_9TELE|nr:hypothetical protein E1301_Tti016873 [Triplophysa tibetana]
MRMARKLSNDCVKVIKDLQSARAAFKRVKWYGQLVEREHMSIYLSLILTRVSSSARGHLRNQDYNYTNLRSTTAGTTCNPSKPSEVGERLLSDWNITLQLYWMSRITYTKAVSTQHNDLKLKGKTEAKISAGWESANQNKKLRLPDPATCSYGQRSILRCQCAKIGGIFYRGEEYVRWEDVKKIWDRFWNSHPMRAKKRITSDLPGQGRFMLLDRTVVDNRSPLAPTRYVPPSFRTSLSLPPAIPPSPLGR